MAVRQMFSDGPGIAPAGTGGTLRRRFLSRSRRPAGETSGTDQCRASILYKFSIRKYLPLVKTGGVRNQAAFPGGFWGVLTKAPSLLPFPPKCSKIQLLLSSQPDPLEVTAMEPKKTKPLGFWMVLIAVIAAAGRFVVSAPKFPPAATSVR